MKKSIIGETCCVTKRFSEISYIDFLRIADGFIEMLEKMWFEKADIKIKLYDAYPLPIKAVYAFDLKQDEKVFAELHSLKDVRKTLFDDAWLIQIEVSLPDCSIIGYLQFKGVIPKQTICSVQPRRDAHSVFEHILKTRKIGWYKLRPWWYKITS